MKLAVQFCTANQKLLKKFTHQSWQALENGHTSKIFHLCGAFSAFADTIMWACQGWCTEVHITTRGEYYL